MTSENNVTVKKYQIYLICIVSIVFFVLSFLCWFTETDSYSESERRVLASKPVVSAESIKTGKFMTAFEEYTTDRFPFRDGFRRLKAVSQLGMFRQKDNNDIYLADGYVSKLEYPMRPYMLQHAVQKFESLYQKYMSGFSGKLYLAVIPDKNYYLAENNGYLTMDYSAFFDYMKVNTREFMEYIDVTELLSIEDYYKTDTHWRQECLVGEESVSAAIAEAMGNTLTWQYEEIVSEYPFYGVYYGQSALPLEPDKLTFLDNDLLRACKVTSYDTGKPVQKEVYNLQKLNSRDPYEMFMAGSDALLVVENPNATDDKELVVFRDSFGSSLIPLLIESYKKVTLVDIRYINSNLLGEYIAFADQDVLFLYSTLVLNSSTSFK